MPDYDLLADPSTLPVLITRVWEASAARREWGRRKLRLFACACCRRVWSLLPDDLSRRALEVAERHADGKAQAGELAEVRRLFGPHPIRPTPSTCAVEAAEAVVHRQVWEAAQQAAYHSSCATGMVRGVREEFDAGFRAEREVQTVLLRDVVGQLNRPALLDRRLLAPDVVGVASGIYEDRAFDRLPILADALMDAGCDDEAILAHCRSEGPHVRGCWVIDLLLGKS